MEHTVKKKRNRDVEKETALSRERPKNNTAKVVAVFGVWGIH